MRGRRLQGLVLVLALSIGLTGCGLLPQGTVEATLEELVLDQDGFDGRTVITEGIVQGFDEPRHYWIEDAAQNRVELFPMQTVERLVGALIRVEGPFTFADDEGRRILIQQIEILEEAPG